MSGGVQSFDPRRASSANTTAPMVSSHYIPHIYPGVTPNNLNGQHQQQHQSPNTPFNYNGNYSSASPNGYIPAFANFIQPRRQSSHSSIVQSSPDGSRVGGLASNTSHAGMIMEDSHNHEHRHGQCPSHPPPVLKCEPQWRIPTSQPQYEDHTSHIKIEPLLDKEAEIGGTEVDTLMRVVQSKAENSPLSATIPESPQGQRWSNFKKRHACTYKNCTKTFYQKTHLDIHMRKHTGAKPYPCKVPGCDRSFSQVGNLTTHMRRHTGERPFACEVCGKRFAQRGNVAAHKIVHNAAKPFICQLDKCRKQFTQLGNLKSHQNKVHKETLRTLTLRFATITDSEMIPPTERDIFESFARMYRNANKGIKGRGKDRKVGAGGGSSVDSPTSSIPPPSASSSSSFVPRIGGGELSISSYDGQQGQQQQQSQRGSVISNAGFESAGNANLHRRGGIAGMGFENGGIVGQQRTGSMQQQQQQRHLSQHQHQQHQQHQQLPPPPVPGGGGIMHSCNWGVMGRRLVGV